MFSYGDPANLAPESPLDSNAMARMQRMEAAERKVQEKRKHQRTTTQDSRQGFASPRHSSRDARVSTAPRGMPVPPVTTSVHTSQKSKTTAAAAAAAVAGGGGGGGGGGGAAANVTNAAGGKTGLITSYRQGSSTCHVSLVHSLDVKEALNRRGIYVIASTCHSSIRST